MPKELEGQLFALIHQKSGLIVLMALRDQEKPRLFISILET